MDRARAAVAEIMRAENALLAARTATANRDELIGFIIANLVSGFAILGLGALMVSMTRTTTAASSTKWKSARCGRGGPARQRGALPGDLRQHRRHPLRVIEVGADGVFRIAEVDPAYERATGQTTAMTCAASRCARS